MGLGHGNGLDLFDTFGGGNDFGAMDDFGIPAIPEPSSRALPASGLVGDWQPLAARFDKQVPPTRSFIAAVGAGILVRSGTATSIAEA